MITVEQIDSIDSAQITTQQIDDLLQALTFDDEIVVESAIVVFENVENVDAGLVQHLIRHVSDDVTPSQLLWICNLLSRASEEQTTAREALLKIAQSEQFDGSLRKRAQIQAEKLAEKLKNQ